MTKAVYPPIKAFWRFFKTPEQHFSVIYRLFHGGCGIKKDLIKWLELSKIKLNIKKCNITNIKEGRKKKGIDKEIAIYLEFFLLGFIKIGKIKITEKLLEKLKIILLQFFQAQMVEMKVILQA